MISRNPFCRRMYGHSGWSSRKSVQRHCRSLNRQLLQQLHQHLLLRLLPLPLHWCQRSAACHYHLTPQQLSYARVTTDHVVMARSVGNGATCQQMGVKSAQHLILYDAMISKDSLHETLFLLQSVVLLLSYTKTIARKGKEKKQFYQVIVLTCGSLDYSLDLNSSLTLTHGSGLIARICQLIIITRERYRKNG